MSGARRPRWRVRLAAALVLTALMGSGTAAAFAADDEQPIWADFNYVGPSGGSTFVEGYRFTLTYSCGPVEADIVSCVEASGYASGSVIELRRTDENGGQYTFTVTATAADGRTATASRTITVLPAVEQTVDSTLTAVTGSLDGWNSGDVTVRVTPVVPNSATRTWAYLSTGGTWYSTTAGALTYDIRAEGRNRVHYYAATESGSGPVRDAEIKIDRTAPFLSSVTPAALLDASAPPTYTRGDQVRVTFICSDPLSGLAECGGDLASGDLLPTDTIGDHTLTVLARDNAGNETTRSLHYSVIAGDGTMRGWFTGATPLTDGWFTGPGAVRVHVATNGADDVVRVRASQGSGWGSTDGTFAYLDFSTEGRHAFQWYGEDARGRVSETFTGEVGIDLTAPTVTTTLDESGELRFAVNQSVPVQFACDDRLSGVAACASDGIINGALPTSTEGSFTVRVTARDVAGNETVREISYVVDPTLAAVPDPGDGDNGNGLPTNALASTGADSGPVLVVAAILLLLGASLVTLRVARR